MNTLIIIGGSALIYFLGASYSIFVKFKDSAYPISYLKACGIFSFLIWMSLKHPFHGRRFSSFTTLILLYQIFSAIFKVYYEKQYEKHPNLTTASQLAVTKRKYESGIQNVYETLDKLKN